MNLLILSCGTRNMLVRFFKKSGYDKIVVTDCSELAPALYEADAHYIVPRMTTLEYLPEILKICEKEQIDALLPLQEDELHLIAMNEKMFLDKKITPVVSMLSAIDICRDKMNFYRHLQQLNIPALPSYSSFQELKKALETGEENFPVFIKPISGAGSIGAMKVMTPKLLEALLQESEEPLMIQHLSTGKEYGIDLYADLITGEITRVFIKEKIRMRAGETEKSVSVKNKAILELVCKTAESLPLKGPIDMDIFESQGNFYVSEINPRFGGGYPHAYGCGVDFPTLILENLQGKKSKQDLEGYEAGVYAMKYSDIQIKDKTKE